MKASVDLPIEFASREHEALMSIWWTSLLLKKVSGKFFQPELASEAQFNILVLLNDSNEELSQKDLGVKLLVDKSNITGLLDRLEKQGCIERTPHETDRRSYTIRLTKSGKKLAEKLDKRYVKRVHEIMSALTKKEIEEIIRLMRKVRNGLATGGG